MSPERFVAMVYYYLYMGLLITALVLWLIVAFREDDGGNGEPRDEG